LAKRLNIAIVVTSQLSRSVELRGGSKRPLLSDLRDSGSIEEEAHVVAFLYRPEYYALEYTEMGEMLVPGATELIVSKHKNGPTGSLYYKFIPEVLTFEEVKNETDLIDTSVNSPFENPVL
jgi:replicative DNA helicase